MSYRWNRNFRAGGWVDHLPDFYDTLSNVAFARQWSRVLFAICVLDEDERSLLMTCKQILGERELYKEMGWEEGIKLIYRVGGEAGLNLELAYMAKLMSQVKPPSGE